VATVTHHPAREASTPWLKATASSGGGDCVEMRRHDGHVEVRDSKHPTGPVLRVTPAGFTAWLDGATNGEFGHRTAG
jgi:hypothetical protein